MIKIILVGFDYGKETIYKTMHDVLLYSIEKHVPNAIIISNWLSEPQGTDRTRAYLSNTIKLRKWYEELQQAERNEKVVFLDCDMLVTDDFTSIYEEKFDIAYTYRTKSRFPLNGGAIFCRATEKTLDFFKLLLEVNENMYKDFSFHLPWKNKYGGMNQAAFGYIIEKEKYDANVLPVPCSIWNSCESDDPEEIKGAKIVHYKGPIRRAMFNNGMPVQDCFKVAVDLWRSYHAEMLECARSNNPQ